MQKQVRDIFYNYIFSVPSYQRDFAWGKDNLEDLWEDLLEAELAKDDKMGHFLGTIVVSKNSQNSKIYDIIDGQQRATTLFMLRYALNYKTSNPERNINRFLDDSDNFRLQVIEENKDFFKKILKQAEKNKIDANLKNEAKTNGQEKIYEVFDAILSKLQNIDEQRAKKLLELLDSMVLMQLVEEDSGRAIRMFQTVNDRGVPLLILDKLKALLILYSNKYCGGVLDDSINERFGEIFKIATKIKKCRVSSSIADKDFAKSVEARVFYYHCLGWKNDRIGHYSYGVDESYKQLKECLKSKLKENSKDLKSWLDDYSSDLLEFFKAFLELAEMADKNVEAFKLFYVLKIKPYFYSSLVRLQINKKLDDECLVLFAKAQILFYGLGSENDASAYGLYEFTNSKQEFKTKLIEIAKKRGLAKNDYKDFNEFIDCIYEDNFDSKWKKYFHYFFLTYHSKNLDIDILRGLIKDKTYNQEIEHIIPQNAVENGLLKKYGYGFKDEDDFDNFKNTFGNLLVLEPTLNSQCSDKALIQKQEFYKESTIPYNREFANKEDFLEFNKEAIKQENEKFTQWTKEFFKDFLK